MADHRVSAVKKVDIAYTSPSTAENQTDVMKALDKPAANPAIARPMFWPNVGSSSLPTRAILPMSMVTHAINMAAKADDNEDIRLTAKAMSLCLSETRSATQVNILPINTNKPAPGG